MTEYTYYNHVLRVKSNTPIVVSAEVTIVKETADTITETVYDVGRPIKREETGGYYYAWFDARPVTVTVDNSPNISKQVSVIWDDMAEAYRKGVQEA